MTSRDRLLAALQRRKPDRLPVTTHHVMPYFLEKYLSGISKREFFDRYGMDAILWTVPHRPDTGRGEYYDPDQGDIGFLESRRIATDRWRVSAELLRDGEAANGYRTTRYRFTTPKGTLTTVLQSNEHTEWITEHLIKKKSDIEIIAAHMTIPKCDVEAVNRSASQLGERGIVRGHVCPFDVYGQPGTWQDACCLVGTQRLIMETYDDSSWVHELLRLLQSRKLGYIRSMKGARFDVNELGGGDASTTVISPRIFNEYVAPYDSELIAEAHEAGQRIVYHTCGGMMPILEDISSMNPDAMETFTPRGMGGDADLNRAKQRIGKKVCMIGGFDQQRYFLNSTPEETRRAVRRNFESAGQGGGYILAPSDHFFDVRLELLKAFADEARACVY